MAVPCSASPSFTALLGSARACFVWRKPAVSLRASWTVGGCSDGRPMSRMPLVECSSRPQKKCTAHHNKTRPKKHSPSDKNRKPAVYPRLPKPPPVATLGWDDTTFSKSKLEPLVLHIPSRSAT